MFGGSVGPDEAGESPHDPAADAAPPRARPPALAVAFPKEVELTVGVWHCTSHIAQTRTSITTNFVCVCKQVIWDLAQVYNFFCRQVMIFYLEK